MSGSISHHGGTDSLLDNPKGVFVKDNYAYVTSRDSHSLEIVNVSTRDPFHAGSLVDGQTGAHLSDRRMSMFTAIMHMSPIMAVPLGLEVIDIADRQILFMCPPFSIKRICRVCYIDNLQAK